MRHSTALRHLLFSLLTSLLVLQVAGAAPRGVDKPVSKGLSAWKELNGDSTGNWKVVGDVSLDPANDARLVSTPGKGVIVNHEDGRDRNILTREEYGDAEVHVEFAVSRNSNSGVYLMGRYEIQILDSWDQEKDKPKEDIQHGDCGGIYQRWDPKRGSGNEGFDGHAPRVNACRKPGEWQSFDITFQAPRFDESGKLTSCAKFVKVVHNGVVVHENVEVKGPTRAASFPDLAKQRPTGPLMLQGDHGPVAYRNISIRPLEAKTGKLSREKLDNTGFVTVFDGKSLKGWHVSSSTGHSRTSGNKSGGRWVVEDGAIVGSQDIPGNGGIVITDKKYGDFEVVLEMKNDYGPDSGLFLRSTETGAAYQYLVDYHGGGSVAGLYGEGMSPGFHARNYSFLDRPEKIQAVTAPFPLPVSPEDWPEFWKHGEWNELRARIVGSPARITTWINGVRFMEWKDPQAERKHPKKGGIALQVHGGGDFTKQFVRYRKVRVKELDGGK